MDEIEQNHDRKHQTSIEDIKKCLVPEQIAIVPRTVLDHPEDRTNKDHQADGHQNPKMLLPTEDAVEATGRWDLLYPHVEAGADEHKKAEKEELDEETDDDDLLTQFHAVEGSHGHDAATT